MLETKGQHTGERAETVAVDRGISAETLSDLIYTQVTDAQRAALEFNLGTVRPRASRDFNSNSYER